jgi:hypothetical protein
MGTSATSEGPKKMKNGHLTGGKNRFQKWNPLLSFLFLARNEKIEAPFFSLQTMKKMEMFIVPVLTR